MDKNGGNIKHHIFQEENKMDSYLLCWNLTTTSRLIYHQNRDGRHFAHQEDIVIIIMIIEEKQNHSNPSNIEKERIQISIHTTRFNNNNNEFENKLDGISKNRNRKMCEDFFMNFQDN